jgi:hypothetical protein
MPAPAARHAPSTRTTAGAFEAPAEDNEVSETRYLRGVHFFALRCWTIE